jgi:hypothetical protein
MSDFRKKEDVQFRIKTKKLSILMNLVNDRSYPHPKNCTHGGLSPTLGHICMFGAQEPESWPGDLCSDVIASSCPYFKPHSGVEDACKSYLNSILEDPEALKDTYPDLFELYWVLGLEEDAPYYKSDFTWYERFYLNIKRNKNFFSTFLK